MSKIQRILEEVNSEDLSLEDKMKKIIDYHKQKKYILTKYGEPVKVKDPQKELFYMFKTIEDSYRKFEDVVKYPVYVYYASYPDTKRCLVMLFSIDGEYVDVYKFSGQYAYTEKEIEVILTEE